MTDSTLPKTYDPQQVEQALYDSWEGSGAFACDVTSNAAPYTIAMPPPNVTGSLHMGHALTFTLQDILTRYHRMKGHDALWQPGTDHAGIATQMVVERQLGEQGKTRHDLGREAFVKKVWEWKEESGGTIVRQLRRLGASPDWARERFTMDEGLSEAVKKVFVQLHQEGLIYRDKRLVNWDPKLHTAISDLEVEQRETTGSMWYFVYPLVGDDGATLTIATTRPETMFGDTAVAVNPEDEKLAQYIGRQVKLPISGRIVPVVGDEHADPEKGTGAVKITPAHDFNDFAVAQRHNLPMINIFDANAVLNENAPEAYQGLDRFDARKKVVAEMEDLGLFVKVEDNAMTVPYGDRSGVVIEPWLTDQWFVRADVLAKPAIEAVETGKTVFVPKNWENTYFEWMRNIQPWCISRQLWWGHRIPAWYGPDGEIFVAETEEEALANAETHYGKATSLEQDPDVLDTWFSSALWPFSTLGWPEKTPELARYYPTDVLVTGFDIIFFWVARMMMMGLHFMGDVPFRTVYIHALVRDEKGQKMSKSKGNVIDPLEMCETYGTDAVRFTLAAMAAPGRDIKMSESRVAGYRNFATKIWNAARFAQMNGCARVPGFDPKGVSTTLNRWIVAKVAETAALIEKYMAEYRFNEVANTVYHFTWGTFCDWYLEFAKPVFNGNDEAAKAETRATAAWVLDQILMLAHPVIPFVTEELHRQLGGSGDLMTAKWPDYQGLDAPDALAEMDWVVEVITAIRSARAEANIPPGAKLSAVLTGADGALADRLNRNGALIAANARLSGLETAAQAPDGPAAQAVVGGVTVILPLEGAVDLNAEKARLSKEIARLEKDVTMFTKKLGNPKFVENAPEAVVAENREKLASAEAEVFSLKAALERLG